MRGQGAARAGGRPGCDDNKGEGGTKLHAVSGGVGEPAKGRVVFFFEKKNQKTFVYWRTSVARPATAQQKVFLLLFLQKKKNSCLSSCQSSS
jgi:hypothetical protein